MKIEQVKIKEFKILENLDETIKGNHILIMGDNGVGKSSLIQFIEIALGKQSNIPPLAKGEGEVFVNKDGKVFTFGVKFKDGKPVVTVTSPEGLKDTRKGTIASIVGAVDFDIDEFVELSKTTAGQKKQVEIFKSFLPDDIKKQLTDYAQNIKVKYDERTDTNRMIKEKEGFIKSHRLYSVIGVKKFEQVKIDAVYSELSLIQQSNNKISGFASKVEGLITENARLQNEIKDVQLKLDQLKNAWVENEEKIKNGNEYLKSNPIQDVSKFEEQLKTANEINKDYDDAQSLLKEISLVDKMKDEAGEMTAYIESSKEAVANAIRDMDSPVQGLSFDDDMLVYNGIPVNPDSLSTSEIMELGIRLKMAENKDLGILFIQRAESIGADRFKLIKEIADKAGWQIIAEQVERGEKKLHIEIMTEELISA